jgi:predicted 3-demethylubiquinone-9 3-methyltransferase (glyoxalase superfamily)
VPDRFFTFNPSVSFLVVCSTTEEVETMWDKLSAHPEAEQCGRLKDRYGLSWQIVPTVMEQMLADGDERKVARVTEAFLKMKKFDIQNLKDAYQGKEAG